MSALVFIRPHALQVYYSDHNAPLGIPVPPEAVTDMEVTGEDKLSEALGKYLKTKPGTATNATMLVLSDELCFVGPWSETEAEEATARLISLTPFVHVATAVLRTPKENLVIATNQDLYEAIARLLEPYGYTTQAAVPWRSLLAAGISSGGEVDNVTVKRAFDMMSVLKASAFPLTNNHPMIPKPAEMPGKPAKKKTPWGWIVFGSLAVLYAVGMLVFMLRQ